MKALNYCIFGVVLGMSGGVAVADHVILNDLIVDGSICVGFDCVNGESFGFDTLRLKENNLRIHFQDTSTTANFPTNDWRITVNDSANGGANRFSIDDVDHGTSVFTIEASAGSNALYVDDYGRVGLGTSTPAVELEVRDGDTPTVRLNQDGSSGWSPQTWDVAGNEANFFIRDVTNGSQLAFRIQPGADSNALTIKADGNVGLGTWSPDQRLDLEKNGPVGIDLNNTNSVMWRIRAGNAGNVVINAPNDSTSSADEMVLSPAGDLTIAGGLVTGTAGGCNVGAPCDATFDREKFQVPSIEQHAKYMWDNHYLRGVGPTPEGEPINLSRKTTGILHELEVAHIYIEQLHKQINELKATNEAIAASVSQLQAQVAELSR